LRNKENNMFAKFIYLKEDSKFFIVASIVCALIILVVVTSQLGLANPGIKYNDWAQLTLSAH
jgi:hypothetical protein